MKGIAALLCLSLLGVCFAQNPSFCSARLSTAANAVANGDFESADTWNLINAAYAPAAESGACDIYSLKVDSTLGSSSFSQSFTVDRTVTKPFYFSAWFKGENVALPDLASASFVLDVDGVVCALTLPTGTFDWTQAGVICNADTDPSSVIISGSFSSTFVGTLYVDNVYLCYFGTQGCVYDIVANGYLLNSWSTVATQGNAVAQASEFAGEPALHISSPTSQLVQEIRLVVEPVSNIWSSLVFYAANQANPIFASVGPLKPKTFVPPNSSWSNFSISLASETEVSMLVLASVPTDYYITSVGLQ